MRKRKIGKKDGWREETLKGEINNEKIREGGRGKKRRKGK